MRTVKLRSRIHQNNYRCTLERGYNTNVTQQYWFDNRIESIWNVGSKVLYVRNREVTDQHVVLAVDKPQKLNSNVIRE